MKILELLGLSDEKRQQKEALRKAKALKRGQEKLIDKLDAENDALLAKKESLLHAIVNEINEDTWNQEYQDVCVELEILDRKIKIAKKNEKEFF